MIIGSFRGGSSESLLLASSAAKFLNGLMALKILSEQASTKSSISLSDSFTSWAAANPGSCGCKELDADLCAAVEEVNETTKPKC